MAVADAVGDAVAVGSGSTGFSVACQSGARLPSAPVVVTRRSSAPLAVMVWISGWPSALVPKAMRVPSGENAGVALTPGRPEVRFAASGLASAALTWTWPSRRNAIRVLSGDHDGSRLLTPVVSVSGRSSSPAAVIAKISLAPPLRDVSKAMVEPSGDQAGSRSLPASVVSRTGLAPFASMTQMSGLPSVRLLMNASFEPSGDHAGSKSLPSEVVSRVRPPPSAPIT